MGNLIFSKSKPTKMPNPKNHGYNAVLLCTLFAFASGVSFINTATNGTMEITAFNALPWTSGTSVLQFAPSGANLLPIIAIDDATGDGFDPCDPESFSKDAHLVEAEYWVAFASIKHVKTRCEGSIPLHLNYATLSTLMAQQLGASALLLGSNSCPEVRHFLRFYKKENLIVSRSVSKCFSTPTNEECS